ncbi:MAG: AlpA family phage regulatory protein [Methylovulum miyakonense]|uniref:helix-turn-helix transcriptional regulator n=1 Tax=Methylovulum miyakonense TaxID=645578 RepID=UPI003BB537FB
MTKQSNPQPRHLNELALLRLAQIIGNPKANPPIPALIPVGRTTFLNGVKSGKYPKPLKLGARSVAWRSADIFNYLESIGG